MPKMMGVPEFNAYDRLRKIGKVRILRMSNISAIVDFARKKSLVASMKESTCGTTSGSISMSNFTS
jgi:hypothetical protein